MSDKPELPPYDLADMGRAGGLYNEKTLRAYGELCAAAVMERAAVIAWMAGMDAHTKTLGMPCDAREVGSACAAAIRAALQE
jgi:hypothetical protein